MKIVFALLASIAGLLLGSCVEQPLISDEEYNATHGPAPNSPDPVRFIPQSSTGRASGY